MAPGVFGTFAGVVIFDSACDVWSDSGVVGIVSAFDDVYVPAGSAVFDGKF